MSDRQDQTTSRYRVIESSARGNRYMVVDNRGDAELGNWFVASTWWREAAEVIATLLNEKGPENGIV